MKYLLFQGLVRYCLPSLRLQTSSPLLLLNLFFVCLVSAKQHIGSSFLEQGLNLCPLHWKHRVVLFCCFFLIFFWCGIFLVFIEFVTILLLFLCFVFFWPWSLWDPSSPTRDWNCTPFIGRQSLNHWTAREVPVIIYIGTFILLFIIIIHGTVSYSQIIGNLKSRENIFVLISFYPRASHSDWVQ